MSSGSIALPAKHPCSSSMQEVQSECRGVPWVRANLGALRLSAVEEQPPSFEFHLAIVLLCLMAILAYLGFLP